MTHTVLTSKTNGVLHIELNRPEKKNAITLEMYGLIADSLESANHDKTVRAIIISGRGSCFTAGNDLADFLSNTGGLDDRITRFIHAMPNCQKPIIAAIHGHTIGIGTTLLLHCDMVYADSSARLQLPFVNLGLCPEFGSSLLLPQLIGHRRAAELLLLGEAIDATKACEYGLINAVVDDALGKAREQANKLSALPAASLRLTKSLIHQADKDALIAIMETEGKAVAQQIQSPEAREAMTAFMERRKPDFSQFD
jgi:enoyl-CoA hydratase/carnithine racemase